MNKIAIYHHLGMGDAIECNGMVRHFAEKYEFVDIFAKESYHEACSFMYRDNDRIIVNKIDGNNEKEEVSRFLKDYKGEITIPGHQNYFKNISYFKSLRYGPGESFYHIANVPWQYRNEKFHIDRDESEEQRVLKKLNPYGQKFFFVHDDPSRGHTIDVQSPYMILKNDPSESFFSMLGVLEAAEEVHCMSSSFLCLIDCLDKKIKIRKKFLHKQVRNVDVGPNGLLSDWEIL